MKKLIAGGVRLLLVAFCAACAFGAQAATYDVVSDWASVSSAGYQDGKGDLTAANGWQDTAGVATVANHVICVDEEEADAEGALVYTPQKPTATNGCQVTEVHCPAVFAGGLPSDSAAVQAQAALVVAVDANDATNWYGWCANGWTKLTGAVPPTSGGCDVRFLLSNAVNKVCYAVKTGDSWTELKPKDADNGWLTKGTSGASVGNVAFKGKTALTDVKLTQVGTVTASATMEERMTAQGITSAELNTTAANGNKNWENLVLGLTGSNPSSKPVVQPVQSADASHVTLALGGVNVDTTSGATVTYTVTKSDTIGGTGTTTGSIAYNVNASVDLPATGVQYYRMNVATSPAN